MGKKLKMYPGYVRDYQTAAQYLERGRNKDDRPFGNNTRLVRTTRGIGIKHHQTIIVEYLKDLSILDPDEEALTPIRVAFALWTGGWHSTTTKKRITNHTKVRLFHQKGCLVVATGKITPPKIRKCRICRGTGQKSYVCKGWEFDYTRHHRVELPEDHPDRSWLKYRRYYGVEPCNCQRLTDEYERVAHRVRFDCYMCDGKGVRDYGSKPRTIGFREGMCFGADGLPLEMILPKPIQIGSPSCFVSALTPPPVVQNLGITVLERLGDMFPALKTESTRCPSERIMANNDILRCGATATIMDIVIHLNDQHRWTRHHICDWLDTLDVDLTFPTPEKIRSGVVGEPS